MENESNQTSTKRKILMVEDEHFISELYVRALSRAGYDVTVEIDGQKGLELARTNQFDIILLDLMVPTITGMDVLEQLRTNPGLKAKIVITTNLEQREEARTKVEKQADAYIVKAEVTPRELAEFLGTHQVGLRRAAHRLVAIPLRPILNAGFRIFLTSTISKFS
jgi:DNA-binding response OmpR family regulator